MIKFLLDANLSPISSRFLNQRGYHSKSITEEGLGYLEDIEIIKLAKKDLKPKPKIIRLGVFPTNKPAISLYKKLGFKKVARVPRQFQYKGKLVDEIIMLLSL